MLLLLLAIVVRAGWAWRQPSGGAAIDALPDQREYLSLSSRYPLAPIRIGNSFRQQSPLDALSLGHCRIDEVAVKVEQERRRGIGHDRSPRE